MKTVIFVLAGLLLWPGVSAAEQGVTQMAVNTARVWLTLMEQLAADVDAATTTDGVPSMETNFTIARAHR
jgi:hypothetical protein